MSEIGVLVKVPEELHSKFKRASARHQRSMQKVMVALLEGWIENGAPDPLVYGSHGAPNSSTCSEDIEARKALIHVAAEIKELKERLAIVERAGQPERKGKLNFDAFYDALNEVESSTQEEATK